MIVDGIILFDGFASWADIDVNSLLWADIDVNSSSWADIDVNSLS